MLHSMISIVEETEAAMTAVLGELGLDYESHWDLKGDLFLALHEKTLIIIREESSFEGDLMDAARISGLPLSKTLSMGDIEQLVRNLHAKFLKLLGDFENTEGFMHDTLDTISRAVLSVLPDEVKGEVIAHLTNSLLMRITAS